MRLESPFAAVRSWAPCRENRRKRRRREKAVVGGGSVLFVQNASIKIILMFC